jgi:hypothetical protein
MTPVANIFVSLLVAGMLGMLGQAVRVIAGLKKMNDDASLQATSAADLFNAARLIVSLLIGFLAGIAAGLAIGLDKLTGITANSTDVLLGIAAAGYAGTDFIEAFAATLMNKTAPIPASPQTGPAQPQSAGGTVGATPPAADGVNAKYGVTFGSLVPSGFFSSDPDNLAVPRSIRTNNPGALNFSPWQKSRLGYVGVTQPDNSPNHNVTTIYRTPEHGVAAWYHLIAVLYNFTNGSFTLTELAGRYAGSNNAAAISGYLAGWNRWLNPAIPNTAGISVADSAAMSNLAKAMFSHEAGKATPVSDAQIRFGIDHERAGTLPA